ncbi:hypothetical protein GCM10009677_23480 [Sphaerisporangium rubeum]
MISARIWCATREMSPNTPHQQHGADDINNWLQGPQGQPLLAPCLLICAASRLKKGLFDSRNRHPDSGIRVTPVNARRATRKMRTPEAEPTMYEYPEGLHA